MSDITIERQQPTGRSVIRQTIQADSELQPHADEHFRLLVEGVNEFAMFLIDQDEIIASWNKGAELIFGYSAQEAIGMPAAEIFTDEDRANGVLQKEIITALLRGRAPDRRWHKKKDGSLFWADGIMQRLDNSITGVPQGIGKVLRDATRDKEDQIALAESASRERAIATQLQSALIPPPPGSLPGLMLAAHYEPALAEAQVGGDFYDIFAVSSGCTAIVLGDLSGKGLDAAQQVTTVRNMLRYALYNAQTTADAVNSLNRTLTDHKLLKGFATLFVGVYDDQAKTLTYANCGQESGLIWRASTGRVEELPPTGPVLGSFVSDDSDEYQQQTVTLNVGDVFALFTDGLTEAGPSHRDMLETKGVSALFGRCLEENPHAAVEAIVQHIIAAVNAFAQGGTRDDVALLVGVAV